MSVITFPESLGVARMSWAQQRRDMSFASVFGSQSIEVSPPAWLVTLDATGMKEIQSGEWQSLLMRMRGQTNQLELWNLGRPYPLGTMRGSMALNVAAAQGDVALSIVAAGELGKTLLAGDMLGLGSGSTQQVVMVTADAVSDGLGIIGVTIEPPLRNAHLISAVVTWSKPKVLFRRTKSDARWEYANIEVGGFSLDLIEDTRP